MATVTATSASHKAFQILHFGYTVAPLIAGLDKYFDKLTDWDKYLAPVIASRIPAHTFMLAVGAIEIVAALIVLFKPRIGAFIVAAWLLGIVVNLLIYPGFFDVALRDFGLALGALSLGFLSADHERPIKERASSGIPHPA
jgi:hypothetical protein